MGSPGGASLPAVDELDVQKKHITHYGNYYLYYLDALRPCRYNDWIKEG